MSSTPASAARPVAPIRASQTVGGLLVACIAIQAALSGPAWFLQPSLFELHGWLGIATLLLAALAVLTFVVRMPVWTRLTSLLLVVGSFGQIGLGYAGHRGGLAVASSIHIPLGVALLGMAVAVAVAARLLPHAPIATEG